MGRTSCEYSWHETGKQVFWDSSTFETLWAQYPIYFYDDFLGPDTAFPLAGSDESGCKWVYQGVGTNDTGAKLANTQNGIVQLFNDNLNEAKTAQINMDDQLAFSIGQGLIFEARVRMSVMPDGAASRGIFGMGGAYVAAGPAHRVGFEILENGVINAEEDDAATDTPGSTGVTAVAGAYNIFRIDCTTQTDIKFFIDGARVAGSTTFANASAGANLKMQPYFSSVSTNGDLATMLVDFVKIWQNRA